MEKQNSEFRVSWMKRDCRVHVAPGTKKSFGTAAAQVVQKQ